MKKQASVSLVPVRQTRPAKPEAEEPTALTVAFRLPKIQGKTPGARINFLHKLSVESGKVSIAAGILAGWELSRARAACDHGQWLTWLESNTDISPNTARNYMEVYAKTLGAARMALPTPVPAEKPPTSKEVEAASANVEAKSLSALYAQLRLLKRSANHGGDRREAAAANGKRVGRHPKGGEGGEAAAEAAELDAIANNPALLYAAIRGPLDQIWKLHSERDVFSRLGLEELANVQTVLRDLADAATGALDARHALV